MGEPGNRRVGPAAREGFAYRRPKAEQRAECRALPAGGAPRYTAPVPDDLKRTTRGDAAAGEAARVGAELREARQSLGLGVDDVAASLKIRRVYLDAIEEGRVRDLPAPAYAVGFVRTYARALGLDEAGLVRRFRDGAAGAATKRADLVFPEPVPERGVPAGAVILLGAVLAVGGYVGWYQWSARQERVADVVPPLPPRLEAVVPPSAPMAPPPAIAPPPTQGSGAGGTPNGVPAATVPRPPPAGPLVLPGTVPPAVTLPPSATPPPLPGPTAVPAPAAAPPPSASPPRGPDDGRITLRARSDAWVQLRERGNGAILVNRTLRAGEVMAVPARDGLLLTTGNAAGLEVLVDGQAAPGFAPGNGVRRDVAMDPDRLKTTVIPAPPRAPPRPVDAPATTPQ